METVVEMAPGSLCYLGKWLASEASQKNAFVILACFALIALLICRLRLSEQKFDLLIDHRRVRVNLYMDWSRRAWIVWASGATSNRSCITEPYFTGWVDHEIALGTEQYKLRILVKPIGSGFLISNFDRGFKMEVLSNSC